MRLGALLGWCEIRRADIPQNIREECEVFGTTVLSFALSQQFEMANAAIRNLVQQNYWHVVSWLREQRDIAERHEQRLETLEWAILIFVGVEVITDLWPVIKLIAAAIARAYAVPAP